MSGPEIKARLMDGLHAAYEPALLLRRSPPREEGRERRYGKPRPDRERAHHRVEQPPRGRAADDREAQRRQGQPAEGQPRLAVEPLHPPDEQALRHDGACAHKGEKKAFSEAPQPNRALEKSGKLVRRPANLGFRTRLRCLRPIPGHGSGLEASTVWPI